MSKFSLLKLFKTQASKLLIICMNCMIIVTVFSGAMFANMAEAGNARVKDLVDFEGVRGNDLVGYGLVVGLNGTGDGLRNSPFTEEALANLLERLGINVTGEQFRPKNVAAVLVTAVLPPFGRAGSQIDVSVSAIGDAKSLLGGMLIMTPLNAADGEIYAVAQGSIIAGGAVAEGAAETVTKGVPTSGSIPSGARIEREIDFEYGNLRDIHLALRDPDFTTASRIEQNINSHFGRSVATMLDSGTVHLEFPTELRLSPAHLVAKLENIEVSPAQKARVVVDQRSGTIVMGADVRISEVAVAQGNLTIKVTEEPIVVQPNPFSRNGETIVVPRTDADLEEDPGQGFALVQASVSLSEVIQGLNALGIGPRDMIDILKAIKAAGALHAEFVVQ